MEAIFEHVRRSLKLFLLMKRGATFAEGTVSNMSVRSCLRLVVNHCAVRFFDIKFSNNESYKSVAILRQHLEQHGQHPRAMRAAVVTCSDIVNATF